MDSDLKAYSEYLSLEKGSPADQALRSDGCNACDEAPAERTRGRPFVKRLFIALGAVALTCLLFSYGHRAFYDRPPRWLWLGDVVARPPPRRPPPPGPHGCVGNANWTIHYDQPPWKTDYPHGAETNFSLPLDSDILFLISQGPFQQGVANIKQSTQVSDTVDVRVRVAYFDDILIKLATVCQMERADKEHGVGIFTPPRPPRWTHSYHMPRPELDFDVTVTLPAGDKGPLSVKKLETRLPNYSQNVADLEESVLFDEISLTSANGKLSVQSVTSEVGQFSSLNGEIDGRFNARSSLDLHLSNGPIASTVNLLHRKDADPSSLSLHTMNGQIEAEISLTSDASTGGEFEVDAQSNNGEIELKFTDSPVDSVLRAHAETMVGGVQVELDSAFEGTYMLENVLGSKLVSQHDIEDPAGRGRRRVVSVHETRGRLEGELKWVESDGSSSGNEGHVVLKSFTSSVKLAV